MQRYAETRAETRAIDAKAAALRAGLRKAGVRLRKPHNPAFEAGARAKLAGAGQGK